jgi:phytoene synthase
MDSDLTLEQARRDLKTGSRSFALASLFFRQEEQDAARLLYAWCRYCDDRVDSATGREAVMALNEIRAETQQALEGIPNPQHPWPALARVAHHYAIPPSYFYDCLKGFADDAQFVGIEDDKDLFRYCYRVAGTVGLMMCSVMGVSSQKALCHAVALGRAMQMTNIARDIKEDFLRGRIYLPQSWLRSREIDPQFLLRPEQKTKVCAAILDLLNQAEQLYQEGKAGLRFLPLRAAWAVATALYVYRSIAQTLRYDPALALEERVVVSPLRKMFCVLRASLAVLALMPGRMQVSWRALDFVEPWRES